MSNLRIGITERGDAGIDFDWIEPVRNRRVDGVILITKEISEKFISEVLTLYNDGFRNIIVHCTCTGWGDTIIEPKVPTANVQLSMLEKLIIAGFPVKNCVLRVDPIIPNEQGIRKAISVLRMAEELSIIPDARIRISIYDEYNHVKERMRAWKYNPIYGDSFYATRQQVESLKCALQSTGYTFETCAEPYLNEDIFEKVGCVSYKDLEIMGLQDNGMSLNPQNRTGCLCLSCKTELLHNKCRCEHKCMYCYWKNDK